MKINSATKESQISKDVQDSTKVMEAVKHPLEDTWSIWLCNNKDNKWGQNLIKLTSFDTVEDYWCLYHHMKCPSELENDQGFAIFKNDISPTWEDKANMCGGRWIINFDKRISELDSNWVLTVLTLIGATLDQKDAVCGAMINLKGRKNKIVIWLTDASNEMAVLSVGKEIKKILRIPYRINFHRHNIPYNMFIIYFFFIISCL